MLLNWSKMAFFLSLMANKHAVGINLWLLWVAVLWIHPQSLTAVNLFFVIEPARSEREK